LELKNPFGDGGLERGNCRSACTGWDVIENPDHFYCGFEEIAASNF